MESHGDRWIFRWLAANYRVMGKFLWPEKKRGKYIIQFDTYFSNGLKPPTRKSWVSDCVSNGEWNDVSCRVRWRHEWFFSMPSSVNYVLCLDELIDVPCFLADMSQIFQTLVMANPSSLFDNLEPPMEVGFQHESNPVLLINILPVKFKWFQELSRQPLKKASKMRNWAYHGWVVATQIFFIFIPIWGRFPFWLLFFKWVETTN